MQLLTSALLAAAIAAQAAFATPIRSRSPYALKEEHYAPREWTKMGRANGERPVQLQLGLKQGNMDGLIKHLEEASDPDHKAYGDHLDADSANDLIRPSQETSDLVEEWLRDNGVDSPQRSAAGDWLTIHVPLELVERLLDTEYHDYKHEDGQMLARTTKWSLPRHLHAHIDTIQPTNSFFRGAKNAATWVDKAVAVPAGYKTPNDTVIAQVCNVTSVTPECFMNLYKTKGYETRAADKNSVAFANYLGEIPIRPDTAQFLGKFRPEAVSSASTFSQISIADGPVQDGPLTRNQSLEGISREANLDVQAIAGISWKTPITSWSTGGSPPFTPDLETPTNTNEPYLVWVNYLLAQETIPYVISTSYGDSEQTVPASYAKRVCDQFAVVAARGTTLFFSSGDNGLGSTNKCYSNDGTNTYKFLPAFPASCPWVTTVGATMNFQPEVAVYRPATNNSGVFRDLYAGGSGFSNYFPRPKWQDAVVPAYVEGLGGLYDGFYNKSGRAYPDLAAQGLYFAYVWNGTQGAISGTSASAPLTAGIFSLVNDARIAAGKKSLGYLNPWLYKKGHKALTDILSGSSRGCNVDGFPVKEGWDPVTGWGTPDFPKLLKAAGVRL